MFVVIFVKASGGKRGSWRAILLSKYIVCPVRGTPICKPLNGHLEGVFIAPGLGDLQSPYVANYLLPRMILQVGKAVTGNHQKKTTFDGVSWRHVSSTKDIYITDTCPLPKKRKNPFKLLTPHLTQPMDPEKKSLNGLFSLLNM